MKQRGTYVGSSVEDVFYQFLCDQFGKHDVDRQITIPKTKWAIDFYVRSIDTYVQLDGVYWHGLDRSIEEIAKRKTNRDIVIHKKWLTDREQEQWFSNAKLRLIRITDKDFKQGIDVISLLRNQ
jgi:hypothetical protein